ncbi:hypothetical protein [Xanthobacter sediminis]
MMPESISEQTKDNAFLQRILAHQSDKRRVVNEAMARVMSVYLPTEFGA